MKKGPKIGRKSKKVDKTCQRWYFLPVWHVSGGLDPGLHVYGNPLKN